MGMGQFQAYEERRRVRAASRFTVAYANSARDWGGVGFEATNSEAGFGMRSRRARCGSLLIIDVRVERTRLVAGDGEVHQGCGKTLSVARCAQQFAAMKSDFAFWLIRRRPQVVSE